MNARINQLVKSLLQKDTLEQCSLHEVEQFAERYPYFGAAQLLLTKKLQAENSDRYAAQLQKTYLFFHNPLWVEQLLNETGHGTIVQHTITEMNVAPVSVASTPELITPVQEDVVEPAPVSIEEPAVEIAPEVNIMPEPATIPEVVDIPVEPMPEVNLSAEVAVSPEITEPAPLETTPAPLPEMATAEPEPEKAKEPELSVFNPGMPDAVTGDELLFEPYHTVDYFASQGIKMQEEEVPKDKFSQQLKSFTGWLRTLKKLPAVELGRAPVSTGEHKAELLARDSLQEGDVVTEAMAEVWEKQGLPGKAMDIYRKLSLLEPDKSAYFAAKIEELKKLN